MFTIVTIMEYLVSFIMANDFIELLFIVIYTILIIHNFAYS